MTVHSYQASLVMKVRENCYDGSFRSSPLRVLNPDVQGIPTSNYKDTHLRQLSTDKLEHMKTMYNQFVPPERRPDYLPPHQPSVVIRWPRNNLQPTSGSTSKPPQK